MTDIEHSLCRAGAGVASVADHGSASAAVAGDPRPIVEIIRG